MRLLEFGHVDGDHVLLAAVERFGESERGFGLADPGRTAQHEHADRLVGIVELGAAGFDALGDHRQPVGLADHAPVENLGQPQHVLDVVLDHAADRNAGPVGHHRCDHLFVDMGVDHPLFGIARFEASNFSRNCLRTCRPAQIRCAVAAVSRYGGSAAGLSLPSLAFGGLRISRRPRISLTSFCSVAHSASRLGELSLQCGNLRGDRRHAFRLFRAQVAVADESRCFRLARGDRCESCLRSWPAWRSG